MNPSVTAEFRELLIESRELGLIIELLPTEIGFEVRASSERSTNPLWTSHPYNWRFSASTKEWADTEFMAAKFLNQLTDAIMQFKAGPRPRPDLGT